MASLVAVRNDPYGVLGVAGDADAATIRAAYLRLMREHHPDHHPGDQVAEQTARDLNAAYELLGDAVRRAAYDRLRRPRTGETLVRGAVVVERDPAAAVTTLRAPSRPVAYSPERETFQRSFSAATLRFALALFAVGAVLLLTLAAQ